MASIRDAILLRHLAKVTRLLLWLGWSGKLRPHQPGKRIAVTPKQEERHQRNGGGHAESGAIHENVEKDDVYDDRAEEGEAERHETTDDEKKSAHNLKRGDGLQITGRGHRTDKLTRWAGHGRHGNEMQKRVRAENGEEQSEENADDDSNDFHARQRARSAWEFNPEMSTVAQGIPEAGAEVELHWPDCTVEGGSL